MTGSEMMLSMLLKSLKINPEELKSVIMDFHKMAIDFSANMSEIKERLTRIENQLSDLQGDHMIIVTDKTKASEKCPTKTRLKNQPTTIIQQLIP